MKIELDLNESQWCELANAVASKSTLVRRGDYGDRDPDEGFDPEAWARELDEVYEHVALKLEERGMAY
jgi:hypothetical protein